MIGRLKSEQGQLFYQFNLEDAVLTITWSGGSMRLSICPGFAVSLHLTIRRWGAPRLILN